MHYVRIPTSALQQQGATASGLSQLILQQHLQQQQQQQQSQATQESSQQTQSSNQQQQTSSNGGEPSVRFFCFNLVCLHPL